MKLNLILILTILISIVANSRELLQPYNLDFEEGESEVSMPVGWTIPSLAVKKGYEAKMTSLNPASGNNCAEIFRNEFDPDTIPEEELQELYGSVMQSFDSRTFRGKRIRIRAAVRTELTGRESSAHIWVHEHLDNKQSGWFYTMEDQPIYTNEWAYYEIEGEIAANSAKLNYGLLLKGSGLAWIDDVSIEVIEPRAYEPAPHAELSERELLNLTAFAHMYGDLKFFYAGDEARKANWEAVNRFGVLHTLGAIDDDELVNHLNKITAHVAPAAKVYKSMTGDFSYKKPENAIDDIAYCMLNSGIYTTENNDLFYSKRHNIYNSLRTREAAVFKTINALNIRNNEVYFSASVKVQAAGPEAYAQLWVRIDREGEKPLAIIPDERITSGEWNKYTVKAKVPENAANFTIGLVFIGEGKAWFDDIGLLSYEGKERSILALRNIHFESEIADRPDAWKIPASVEAAGYKVSRSDDASLGEKSLLIESDPQTRISLPKEGDVYTGEILPGIFFGMPLLIYSDNTSTLPYPANDTIIPDLRLFEQDRYSRIATVIDAWNYIKHFGIYQLTKTQLEQILAEVMQIASSREDGLEYALNRLLVYIEDSRARAWKVNKGINYGLPFLWRGTEEGLIIYKVADSTLGIYPGERVLEYNGRAIYDLIKEEIEYISGNTMKWREMRALAKISSGDYNEEVNLKLQSPDSTIREVKVRKNVLMTALSENRPKAIQELVPAIAYIDVDRFTDKEFYSLRSQFPDVKGFIFDLRGGSSMSEHFLGFFADSSLKSVRWNIPVFTAPFYTRWTDMEFYSDINPVEPRLKPELIFLTDARTTGYAAFITYLAKEHNIGTIMGEATSGALGDIYPIVLPSGYNMTMTITRGKTLQGGDAKYMIVQPDDYYSPEIEDFSKGSYDPLINHALDSMTERLGWE